MGVEDKVFPSHPSQGRLAWKTGSSKLKTTPIQLTRSWKLFSPQAVSRGPGGNALQPANINTHCHLVCPHNVTSRSAPESTWKHLNILLCKCLVVYRQNLPLLQVHLARVGHNRVFSIAKIFLYVLDKLFLSNHLFAVNIRSHLY